MAQHWPVKKNFNDTFNKCGFILDYSQKKLHYHFSHDENFAWLESLPTDSPERERFSQKTIDNIASWDGLNKDYLN